MICQPPQTGRMELKIANTTVNDREEISSEILLEDFMVTQDFLKDASPLPAPFYDELHFANYE